MANQTASNWLSQALVVDKEFHGLELKIKIVNCNSLIKKNVDAHFETL